MNYHKVLGLDTSATPDEVKQAYRKLAMKHHPDRGGDEIEFKKINEAYEKITSPQPEHSFNTGNFDNFESFDSLHKMFRQAHRGGQFSWNTEPEQVKNPDITIAILCSLEEAHSGFTKQIEFTLPDSTIKNMSVTFPPGCTHDIKIRYVGEGAKIINTIPPGDLYVKLNIAAHPIWRVQGHDLFATLQINVWQAMLGETVKLTDIGGTEIEITIPKGTQSRSQLRLKGKGFNVRGTTANARYNAFLEIIVIIPSLTEDDLNKTIVDLKGKL